MLDLRSRIRAALVPLAAPAVLGPGGAAASGPAQSLAETHLSETGGPAVGVVIVEGGTISTGAAGLRRVGGDVAVTRDDLWHVGSLGKAMTAFLAARLVAAGRIGWDDTVRQVLGDVRQAIHPAMQDVTLAELLTHLSGMVANLGLLSTLRLAGDRAARDVMADRRVYAARVLGRAPAGERGAFLYSNAGYVVAGAMLEAAAGAGWENLMAREVFGPLGMTGAGFGAPGHAGALDQPLGHRAGLWGLRAVQPGPRADNIPALGPAGTVHLPLGDMGRWLRAHLDRDPALLPPGGWARLHTPPVGGDYAPGWMVRPDGRLWHNGSNTYWYAEATIWPDAGRALFLVANSGDLKRLPKVFEAAAERAFD